MSYIFIGLLSTISSLILIFAYYPQFKELFKVKRAGGVSHLFWLFISLATSYSLANLIKTGAHWFLMTTQSINALAAIVVFFIVMMYKHGTLKAILYLFLYIGISIFLYSFLSINTTQSVATIGVILAYADQIAYFLIHKRAEGTTPKMYFMFSLALVLLTVSMVINEVHPYIIATEAVNACLLAICLVLSIRYKENKIAA